MLEHLGHPAAARMIIDAFESVLRDGEVRTPDMGGTANCTQLGKTIAEYIASPVTE